MLLNNKQTKRNSKPILPKHSKPQNKRQTQQTINTKFKSRLTTNPRATNLPQSSNKQLKKQIKT